MAGVITREDELRQMESNLRNAKTQDKQLELVLHNMIGYRRGNNHLAYDVETLKMFLKTMQKMGVVIQ